ncbi:hypothetical protein [Aminipila sp.]|uniref:hypothetical protein n=1 Tax=Aminipila sp. TaxID=2060095 RepID=UPI00289E04A7|nr:hypothetical protein [Aminipila sp.]
MNNLQIEIQMEDNSMNDNTYWKQLITMFAEVGLKFEIHCWREELEEIKNALKFGNEKADDWEFGTIIEGIIDDKFIDMLQHTTKPLDTKIYNKMTPFFSIFFENGFSSEHYGTEVHILSAPIENTNFTVLLKQLREHMIINEHFI